MELDFRHSDYVVVITGSSQVTEVSVHQEPVPNCEYYGPGGAMRHNINMNAFAASGPHCKYPLLVQSTSVRALMLVPGTFLPPVTRGSITIQGLTFSPMASAPKLFTLVAVTPAPMQTAAMPSLASVLLLTQSMPYPSAYMAPTAWSMHMPSFLPPPKMEPSTIQSECELLAMQCQVLEDRELEVERRTRAFNFECCQIC